MQLPPLWVTPTLKVSLSGLVSAESMVAVLTAGLSSENGLSAAAVRVTKLLVNAATLPIVHVTMPLLCTPLLDAATKLKPAGRVSVITTSVAGTLPTFS